MFSYIVWLFAFCGGVVGTYFVPDAAIPLEGKFVLIGAWGAVLGFIYYSIAKRKAQDAEADFTETLNEIKQAPRTQYVPVVPTVAADEHKVNTPIPPPPLQPSIWRSRMRAAPTSRSSTAPPGSPRVRWATPSTSCRTAISTCCSSA